MVVHRMGTKLAALVMTLISSVAIALDRTQLAVVVNVQDPLSVEIGNYYARERRIPFQNLIRVSFPPGEPAMSREQFDAIKAETDRQTLPQIQAYALTWLAPYRVECMSITSAFAFGFDPSYCAEGCQNTKPSLYFNSLVRLPWNQLGMRPAMVIAAANMNQARALIDRGVASDGTHPEGSAYLLSTKDAARNVRSLLYPVAEKLLRGRMDMRRLARESLRDEKDVLFYFIGAPRVDGLETLGFVPGAIADHLTSAGGYLVDSTQMSALRWLEAGATGSYGTVVEPCNLLQKFPHPAIVMDRYLRGETLIESYWRSVQMPGQGLFIGEPLAAPFRRVAPAR